MKILRPPAPCLHRQSLQHKKIERCGTSGKVHRGNRSLWRREERATGVLVHYFREREPQTLLVEHYTGIGAGTDHIALLGHLLGEIKEFLHLEEEVPNDPDRIVRMRRSGSRVWPDERPSSLSTRSINSTHVRTISAGCPSIFPRALQ